MNKTLNFGALQQVSIRDLWPHEEHDFTPWLSENLNELGQVLGLDLEFIGREVDVGGFTLDILASETGAGRKVIIENQFGVSNHDHLGKLITYAGGKSGHVLVWVSEIIREEHRQALEWLNEHTDENTLIFGLELNAFRIDDSKPVFQFRPVVLPNNWAKESKSNSASRNTSDLSFRYQEFFQLLLDELREVHRFTNAKKGQAQSWYSFSSGLGGVKFGIWFSKENTLCAEIYIDVGDKDRNKSYFDEFHKNRAELEDAFGGHLNWQRLDHRQACRICVTTPGGIQSTAQELISLRQWAIQQLLRLRQLWNAQMLPIIKSVN